METAEGQFAQVFLDTHVALWLYAGKLDLFSPKVLGLLREATLYVSPIAVLEIDYLKEVDKIKVAGEEVVTYLREKMGLTLADDSLAALTRQASPLSWTREPFDRLIVAHALLRGFPLITKDHLIKKHYSACIW